MGEESKFSLNGFTFHTNETTAAYFPLLKQYRYK